MESYGKQGRIKPGGIKRAALSLQNPKCLYMLLFDTTPFILSYYFILLNVIILYDFTCCLIRPRLYASEVRELGGHRRRRDLVVLRGATVLMLLV